MNIKLKAVTVGIIALFVIVTCTYILVIRCTTTIAPSYTEDVSTLIGREYKFISHDPFAETRVLRITNAKFNYAGELYVEYALIIDDTLSITKWSANFNTFNTMYERIK